MLNIPTEPIGSIPRPPPLIEAIAANPADPALEGLYDAAVRDTIEQFEALSANRRAAVFGFHWYFLASPPPVPEALISAEPALFLEQVMGRWAGSVRVRGRSRSAPR